MAYLDSVLGATAEADYSVGGIRRIALAAHSNIATITKDTAGGKITTITMAGSTKFYEVKLVPNSASLEDVLDTSSRNRFMRHTVGFSVYGEDSATIAAGKKVHLGRYYAVLVQGANGLWYLAGDTSGLNCTVSTANKGAAETDDASRTFALAGTNLGHAPLVDAALALAVIEDGIA